MGPVRLAGVIWLFGAAVYLVCEAIAAAASDGYSYSADFISDLGVHAVMNVGAFMVHGILFLVGAFVVTRGQPTAGRAATGFILAAATNAIGNVLVGVFPSGSAQAHWHVLGAAMAILGGNVAVILAGICGRAVGATPAFRRVSIGFGVVGIACLAVLVIDGFNGSRVLPAGLLERGAVYTIIGWELMAGVAILRRRPGDQSLRVRR